MWVCVALRSPERCHMGSEWYYMALDCVIPPYKRLWVLLHRCERCDVIQYDDTGLRLVSKDHG